MSAPIALKYRAFLSYAHADTAQAKWLHGALEKFHIDKDLAGRETPLGPVPKSLRPIFRDRDDFSGGHSLTDATIAALDASAALIVLCSPKSAASRYVNEEVRQFRARHPGRPVIPVIVEGKYPENFAPALRFAVTTDGTVTETPVTLLAADAQEHKDGRELALAKVVAALIDVPVDDVRKRQLIADRSRTLRYASLATGLAVIVLFAGFLWWQHEHQQRRIQGERDEMRRELADQRKQFSELARRLSLISPAEARTGTERAISEAIDGAARAVGEGDLRLREALEYLKMGKVKEAEDIFRKVAEEKEARAAKDRTEAATAYRHLGAIAGLADPKRAREAYAKALELDPDDLESLYWRGYLAFLAGDLETAERTLNRLLSLSKSRNDNLGEFRAHLRLGQVMVDRGRLSVALEHEQTAIEIAKTQAGLSSGPPDWDNNLGEAIIRSGDVLVDQGNLPAALDAFNASLAIRDRLAKADPGHAGWQRDLSVSQNKIGDVLRAQGNLAEALDSYRASLAIADRLAKADPGNAGWQRDLSISQDRIGDVLRAQGNLPAALDSYRASLAIRDRLAKADPGNAGWQHDVALSLLRVGFIAARQENGQAARAAYERGLGIMQQLVRIAPDHAAFKRDLALFETQIAALDKPQ